MPFYEYRCNSCGHRFEVLQRMSDEPVTVCEECAAEAAERVLFAPAIHFKGSGFHNTDYGTKRRPVGGGDSGGDSSSSSGSSDTGTSSGASDASSSSSSSTVGLDKV
ncbi:MAG: FmdB family zinc ribbon protein [Thermoleophilia bacterium]